MCEPVCLRKGGTKSSLGSTKRSGWTYYHARSASRRFLFKFRRCVTTRCCISRGGAGMGSHARVLQIATQNCKIVFPRNEGTKSLPMLSRQSEWTYYHASSVSRYFSFQVSKTCGHLVLRFRREAPARSPSGLPKALQMT